MKKFFTLAAVAAAFCAAVVYFAFPVAHAQNGQSGNSEASERREKFSKIRETARNSGPVRLIVRLNVPFQADGTLTEPERDSQRKKIKDAADKFENGKSKLRGEKIKKFKFIPFIAVEADGADIDEIEADPDVLTVELDELAEPSLAQSTQIMGAQAAWASGFSGAGQAVAILDTGVEKTHSFLAGKVAAEGCFSTTSTSGAASLCPGGVAASTDPGSGSNCAANIDGCDHGTHVAGTAAGRGTSFSGVAKDANIIAIQVFSRFDTATDCGSDPAPCVRSYSSDQIRGLERVYELALTMSVAAANLSLGGGQYTTTCDIGRSAYKAAIENLRSRNIATVVASGNEGSTTGISAPACISNAISVGSTNDTVYQGAGADTVSPFSNSASILTMLAPGLYISSSLPGGGFGTWGGTSMAAPHAAGAYAILRQKSPTATLQVMTQALVSTGLAVTDTRNGIVKPRINVNAALSALSSTPVPSGGRTRFDFDGDGKADLGVFRPSNSAWYLLNSGTANYSAFQFGIGTDAVAPADYDGDGKTDAAVFRAATGTWYEINSATGTPAQQQFGTLGDIPVPADYDGDGRADIAVFRPSNGVWYRMQSMAGFAAGQFGMIGDKPATGDFDGDGKADLAIFRPTTGVWYILNSSNGQATVLQFGMIGDLPTPADFDGDGRTDVAVFRPSNGAWYRLDSSSGAFSGVAFGQIGDRPAAADFDGDGKADIAVFRPSDGSWYVLRSTAGTSVQQFGMNGDVPAAGAFIQ